MANQHLKNGKINYFYGPFSLVICWFTKKGKRNWSNKNRVLPVSWAPCSAGRSLAKWRFIAGKIMEQHDFHGEFSGPMMVWFSKWLAETIGFFFFWRGKSNNLTWRWTKNNGDFLWYSNGGINGYKWITTIKTMGQVTDSTKHTGDPYIYMDLHKFWLIDHVFCWPLTPI